MKQRQVSSGSSASAWRRGILQAVSGAVLAAMMPLAHATLYNLADSNSTLSVDPTSDMGINSWTVDGVNQLYQQGYWYRIGATGGEQNLSVLTLLGAKATDTNFNPGNNQLSLLYGDGTTQGNSTFTVALGLSLAGGAPGSKTSDLATQLTFTNLTNTGKDVHLFQYSDFDLSGNGTQDQAVTTNANTIVQSDGGMIETDGVVPAPSHWQIGPYSGILDSLSDGNPTTLSDSGGGTVGDTTYARQWDFTLQPAGGANSSFVLSGDQRITVPDPGTLVLLAAGVLGLAGATRGKRSRSE